VIVKRHKSVEVEACTYTKPTVLPLKLLTLLKFVCGQPASIFPWTSLPDNSLQLPSYANVAVAVKNCQQSNFYWSSAWLLSIHLPFK